jgi:hypothetical protein
LVPVTEGNREAELLTGGNAAAGADPEDDDGGADPPTDGNAATARPDTGGNAPCAHTASPRPTIVSSANGAMSGLTIKPNLHYSMFYDPGHRLTTR